MRLIKLVMMVVLWLSIAMPATAAEWVEVLDSDALTAYADLASIRRSGDTVKMWQLYDYKKPRMQFIKDVGNVGYMSSIAQLEYDCKEDQDRVLAATFYSEHMGGGIRLFSNPSPQTGWNTATPSSDAMLKIACENLESVTPAQAVNDGKNGAKNHSVRDSTSNKVTALWTALWTTGLAAIIVFFLTRRYIDMVPKTAHEQGMKWAAWLTMLFSFFQLSKFLITRNIEHFGMLVASLIFLMPIGYVAGFAYFKFRNRNASSTDNNSHAQEYVEETAPAPIKTFSENKITSIQKGDEAVDLARYKQAAEEIESNHRDDSLWYKAFAEGGGDDKATKATYIRLRVEQLRRAAVTTSAAVKVTSAHAAQPPFTKTLYGVLGIAKDASDEQILAGYKKQTAIIEAQINHDAETKKRLWAILNAKIILLDPVKRASYDAENLS